MDSLQQFKFTYITECYELLEDMEAKLIGLEEGTQDNETLNAIFRCAHSIKGGAGAFGFTQITSFTHILETLLDAMREGKIPATRHTIDTLLLAADILTNLIHAARDGATLAADYGQEVANELKVISDSAGIVIEHTATAADAAPAPQTENNYRISFAPHADLFFSGNEPMLIFKELTAAGSLESTTDISRVPPLSKFDPEQCYLSWKCNLTSNKPEADIREIFEFVEDNCDLTIEVSATTPAVAEVIETSQDKPAAATEAKPQAVNIPQAEGTQAAIVTSIRVDVDKVDRLVNMVGELVITQSMLYARAKYLQPDEHSELLRGIDELSQHSRELQEAVMAVRMQPVKSIFSRMPRIVRDLSTQLGKDIKLDTSGENTEVDKTVVEQLGDPLTHMIRNSVDHGIEIPAERVKNGKPAQGTIHLSASHRGGRIIIEVTDDGKGLNRQKILQKAREKKLITEDAQLTDDQIDNLIFLPGFSTADVVSNISGRGVGMDVVRRNIEALGGKISISSIEGKGSIFTVSLPLTLAILDGMIVKVGVEHYIIPIANIIETLRPKSEDVRKIAGGRSVINVRGDIINVLHLGKLFNTDNHISDPSKALIVLIENGRDKFGLVVDELLNQQQVVIKSLEENSNPVEGISGATILGDGKVSLILDIAKLQAIAVKEELLEQSA